MYHTLNILHCFSITELDEQFILLAMIHVDKQQTASPSPQFMLNIKTLIIIIIIKETTWHLWDTHELKTQCSVPQGEINF